MEDLPAIEKITNIKLCRERIAIRTATARPANQGFSFMMKPATKAPKKIGMYSDR